MWKNGSVAMLFNTSEIAISGWFNGPAGFRTEMAKHRLPIRLREPPSNRKNLWAANR